MHLSHDLPSSLCWSCAACLHGSDSVLQPGPSTGAAAHPRLLKLLCDMPSQNTILYAFEFQGTLLAIRAVPAHSIITLCYLRSQVQLAADC